MLRENTADFEIFFNSLFLGRRKWKTDDTLVNQAVPFWQFLPSCSWILHLFRKRQRHHDYSFQNLSTLHSDTLFKEDFSLRQVSRTFADLQEKCDDSCMVLSYRCKDEGEPLRSGPRRDFKTKWWNLSCWFFSARTVSSQKRRSTEYWKLTASYVSPAWKRSLPRQRPRQGGR